MLFRRLAALALLLFGLPLAASAEGNLKVTLYRAVRMAEAELLTLSAPSEGDRLFLSGDRTGAFSVYARDGDVDGESAYMAGLLLLRGEVPALHPRQGVSFMVEAARRGDPFAQYVTAGLFEEGYGLGADGLEAKRWRDRAAEGGVTKETFIFPSLYGEVRKASRSAMAKGERPSPAESDLPSRQTPPPPEAPSGEFKAKNPVAAEERGLSRETLRSVWRRLTASTGFDAELVVDEKKGVNAFIARKNDGTYKIVVFQGLLDILGSEDELAGVVAHEIGHGLHGHIMEGAARDAGIALAADILSRLFGGGRATEIAVGAGAVLTAQGYSREQEVEADDFAVETLARSGYSPWGLYRAIERLAEAGIVTDPSGFNSHPPTERRMTRLGDQARRWESWASQEAAR
jgi:putative metalloprotease